MTPSNRDKRNMTERLSFTKKLILMLIVPIIGLLIFSSLQISSKMSVVSNMQRLDELTGLAVSSSDLIEELQRERGRTAGYLAAGGGDAVSLQGQRGRTDEALAHFRATLQGLKLEGDLKGSADRAVQKLSELPNQRSLVSSVSVGIKEALAYYTETIAALISTVTSVSEQASTPAVALRLVSLDALVREKEFAGQERAMLNEVFTSHGSVHDDKSRMAAIVGEQKACEDLFLAHATDEASSLYHEKMSASFVDDVSHFRSIAMGEDGPEAADPPSDQPTAQKVGDPPEPGAAAAKGSGLDASAKDWWRASTARIDGMFDVEGLIEHDVRKMVADLRTDAGWALAFFAALALLAIASAVVLSYVLARGMIRSFTGASDTLSKVVSQIGGFVQQQSSSTSQTASSVSETTTTVEELRKTAETADSSSKGMSGVAQQSKSASDEALEAVAHGTEAMQHIRSEVEGIAQNILELSEKNIQIGEIVQTVNAIAEQSNLLAVNASIEAAKAGDHGKGFSVVAAEVKALAQQSKEATDQIRSILAEIQKSSNAAVMITEQGVKRVEEGASLIEELGRTIQNLASAIQQSADSASQISLISSQQLAGIEQITEAMRSIGVATSQNAQGARQLEETATEIRTVSSRILEIVQGGQAAA